MPPLALTKSDCTVTSQAPEPADWLATGSVAGEWKRRACVCVCVSQRGEVWGGGYTRQEAVEGLMGIGETE